MMAIHKHETLFDLQVDKSVGLRSCLQRDLRLFPVSFTLSLIARAPNNRTCRILY